MFPDLERLYMETPFTIGSLKLWNVRPLSLWKPPNDNGCSIRIRQRAPGFSCKITERRKTRKRYMYGICVSKRICCGSYHQPRITRIILEVKKFKNYNLLPELNKQNAKYLFIYSFVYLFIYNNI